MSGTRNLYGPTGRALSNPDDPEKSITLGDLHGNPMILMESLIHHGLAVPQDEQAHSALVEAYLNALNEAPQRYDLKPFIACLERFAFRAANAYGTKITFRLIGDTLCDRGNQDYFTLLVFKKMHLAGINFSILMSNHDLAFFDSYFGIAKARYAQTGCFPMLRVTNVEVEKSIALHQQSLTNELTLAERQALSESIHQLTLATGYSYPRIIVFSELFENIQLEDQQMAVAINSSNEQAFLCYLLKMPNADVVLGSLSIKELQDLFPHQPKIAEVLVTHFERQDYNAVRELLQSVCRAMYRVIEAGLVDSYQNWFPHFKKFLVDCSVFAMHGNMIACVAPSDSLSHLYAMLNSLSPDDMLKINQEIETILREIYLPRLKLIDYEYSANQTLWLYTHAPFGMAEIKSLAIWLGVEEAGQTITQFIGEMNHCFSQMICHQAISPQIVFRSLATDKGCFKKLVWQRYADLKKARIDIDQYMPSMLANGDPVGYVHGHDRTDIPEYQRERIKQIDQPIGKISYPPLKAKMPSESVFSGDRAHEFIFTPTVDLPRQITSFHVTRNIYGPTPIAPKHNLPEGCELVVTLGDLHGNPMILVEALIYYGLMVPHDDTAHQDLANAYLSFLDDDLNYDPNPILRCFNRFTFRDKNQDGQLIAIRLIGDTLCDRGNLDYFMLLIYKQMYLANISFSVNMSNHDMGFLEAFLKLNKFYKDKQTYPEASVTNVELYKLSEDDKKITSGKLNHNDFYDVVDRIHEMKVAIKYPFPVIYLRESIDNVAPEDHELYVSISQDKLQLHYCLGMPNCDKLNGSIDIQDVKDIFYDEKAFEELMENVANNKTDSVRVVLQEIANQLLYLTDYSLAKEYYQWFEHFDHYVKQCYYGNIDENKIATITPQDSMMHFFRMLNAFERDMQERIIRETKNILVKMLLPRLNYIDYEYSGETNTLTLFTHAPIGPQVIKSLAESFNELYDDATPQALMASVDRINQHRLRYNHDLRSTLKTLSGNDSFNRLIWQRYRDLNELGINIDQYMPETFNGYHLRYVHGHDHSNETVRPWIAQLDTDLGKVSYPEAEARQNSRFALKAPHEYVSSRQCIAPAPIAVSPFGLFGLQGTAATPAAVTPVPKPDKM